MTTLDSIKVQVPLDCIHSLPVSRVSKTQKDVSDPSTIKTYNHYLDRQKLKSKGIHGLNGAMQDTDKPFLIIEASAKALKDDYLKGISLNTIEQFRDTIEANTGIGIDLDLWLSHPEAILLTADHCQNPPLQAFGCNTFQDLTKAFYSLQLHSKYTRKMHKVGKTSTGIVFDSDHKDEKHRLTVYDKYTELTKEQKDFLSTLKAPNKMLEQAQLTARIESNLVKRKSVRKRFEIIESTIGEVLKAEGNPNVHLIEKMITGRQQELFAEADRVKEQYQPKGMLDTVYFMGAEKIAEICNYDINQISEFMRIIATGNQYKNQWQRKTISKNSIRHKFEAIIENNNKQVNKDYTGTPVIIVNLLDYLKAA